MATVGYRSRTVPPWYGCLRREFKFEYIGNWNIASEVAKSLVYYEIYDTVRLFANRSGVVMRTNGTGSVNPTQSTSAHKTT